MASDEFQVSGSLMWVLTRISDERVPSILSELRLGVLFLFIWENILSSPAFEAFGHYHFSYMNNNNPNLV